LGCGLSSKFFDHLFFHLTGHLLVLVDIFHDVPSTCRLLSGRIACTECKAAASCYRYSVVCMCVCLYACLLDRSVSPAKTAEPIKMPLELCTRVRPKNHILRGGPDPPRGRGNFGGLIPHRKCTVTARGPKRLYKLSFGPGE